MMINDRLVSKITLALAFAIAGLGACSSTSDSNPMNMSDAGTDQMQMQDAGGDGSTCRSRDDLAGSAPFCTRMDTSRAPAIPFTALTGTAPMPAGGTILDGLYVATRAGIYGGEASVTKERVTFVITDGATRMLWSSENLDPFDQVAFALSADTAMIVSGTRITFTVTCEGWGSATPTRSVFPPALDFTVSGQDLVLLSPPGGSPVRETTYTRMGCLP